MKLLLSFCTAMVIYFCADFNVMNLVDLQGVYYARNDNRENHLESLELKEGDVFQYKFSADIDSEITFQMIEGVYNIQGDLIRFFPKSVQKAFGKANQETLVLVDKKFQKKFKQSLSSFESGALRLQPRYHLKRCEDKISLCRKDVRTAQYEALFLKEK